MIRPFALQTFCHLFHIINLYLIKFLHDKVLTINFRKQNVEVTCLPFGFSNDFSIVNSMIVRYGCLKNTYVRKIMIMYMYYVFCFSYAIDINPGL